MNRINIETPLSIKILNPSLLESKQVQVLFSLFNSKDTQTYVKSESITAHSLLSPKEPRVKNKYANTTFSAPSCHYSIPPATRPLVDTHVLTQWRAQHPARGKIILASRFLPPEIVNPHTRARAAAVNVFKAG